MNDREALRSIIAGALSAVRRGSEEDALVLLGKLGTTSGQTARDSVHELATANVEMLFGLVGRPVDAEIMVTLDAEDLDGEPVSIDDLEPSQRAATRVMLSYANDRPEDAQAHLDIVEASGGAMELGHVFVHTLCWTLELLETCEDSGAAVPGWLKPALAAEK